MVKISESGFVSESSIFTFFWIRTFPVKRKKYVSRKKKIQKKLLIKPSQKKSIHLKYPEIFESFDVSKSLY